MSSTGTRPIRTVQSRSNEALIEADKELINSLKIFSEASNFVAGLTGTPAQNSPKTPAGNYLAREGDSMIGPLALGPPLNFRIEVDANNTIDIGPLNDNAQFTSNVQLDDLQPNSSVLDIIANAAFDGQILVLRTFAPTAAYTISQGTLANGGNIQTGDSSDLTVGDLQTITFIFDESLKIEANTGGSWRVLSVSSGGGGGLSEPVILTINTITPQTLPTTSVIDWSKNPNQITLDRDVEFSFSNLPTSGKYEGVLVIIDVDGTGGYAAPIWPAAVTNPPIVSTLANTRTSVMLYTINGGTVVTHATSVGSSSGGGSVSQWATFPAVTDINFATFDGINIDRLIFDQAAGSSLLSTSTGITSDAASNLNFNVPTGASYDLNINGTSEYQFSSTELDVNLNNITSIGILSFLDTSQTIAADTGGFMYNVPTGDTHDFTINNISKFEITNLTIDVKLNSVINAAQISFLAHDQAIRSDTAGIEYLVPTGDTHEFFVNNVSELSIENTVIDVKLNSVINAAQISFLAATQSITADVSGMEYRVPTGDTHEFFVNNVSELLLDNTQLDVKLNSITNAAQISFLESTQFITADTGGMEYNVPTGDTHEFFINSVSELLLDNTQLDVKLNSITNAAQISFLAATQFITADTAGLEYNVPTGDTHDFIINNVSIAEISLTSLTVNRVSSVAGESATLDLIKIDASPSAGDSVGIINFRINDSGVITDYARIQTLASNITDAGLWKVQVRSDNTLQDALIIEGNNNNTQFQFLASSNGNTRIQPLSSAVMGYFVTSQVTDFTLNLGTAGSLEIPRLANNSPSLTDLNQAFGAFDGAFGYESVDERLYVRESSSRWVFFNADGAVT